MTIGIVGYGAYVPSYRLTAQAIAAAWGADAAHVSAGLGVSEKAVAGCDEDAVTIGIQAARHALERSLLDATALGAVYMGSESHPYAVKPSATIVGAALGLSDRYMAADFEFACKGGTAALQAIMGLVGAGMAPYGLAIGADVAQATPGDILEYTAAAGGAAFILGGQSVPLVATIDDTLSVSSDTPDFWRRELQPYPEHAGRFTGEPSYFAQVLAAARAILERNGLQPTAIDWVVFHQPNGKFPVAAAHKLGFSREQLKPGLLAPMIGNCYCGSSLLGLAAVLDQAEAGQRILVVSYGSGAGSDAFFVNNDAVTCAA